MARKTLPINYFLAHANAILAAPDSTAEGREAVCSLIETMLLGTGQYGGFRYIATAEVAGSGSRREYMLKRV